MGRPGNVALGVEWLVLSGVGGVVYVRSYIQASTEGGSRTSLSLARTVFGAACYLAQVAGSSLLIAGYGIGIYLAGGRMMIFFASLIFGAWLLLVGICNKKQSKKV
jgi:hypothetical protein